MIFSEIGRDFLPSYSSVLNL